MFAKHKLLCRGSVLTMQSGQESEILPVAFPLHAIILNDAFLGTVTGIWPGNLQNGFSGDSLLERTVLKCWRQPSFPTLHIQFFCCVL